jgi:hypothetical protein
VDAERFANEPVVSDSARFGLARPVGREACWLGRAVPARSPPPWNLRTAEPMSGSRVDLGAWRHDHWGLASFVHQVPWLIPP